MPAHFLGGAGGDDHARVEAFRHLDRRRADTQTAAMDEQGLAGLKGAVLTHVVPDGEDGFGERRRRDRATPAGSGSVWVSCARQYCRIAAADHQRGDLVAFLPAIHAGSISSPGMSGAPFGGG